MRVRVAEIRERLNASTPGAWESGDGTQGSLWNGSEVILLTSGTERRVLLSFNHNFPFRADSALVANAPADLAALCNFVDRLSSVATGGEPTDTQRLDALELFALNAALGFGSTNFGRVEIEDEDDLDSAAFVVNGPKTSWGLRVGQGNTLRVAIDSAMAWQGAKNLHAIEESTPASDPVERPEVNRK